MIPLRKILEELVESVAEQCGLKSEVSNDVFAIELDLAHQQILELIPKRKEGKISARQYLLTNEESGFNSAIDEMTQRLE